MLWQMLIQGSRIPLTGLIRAAREGTKDEREHRAKAIEYISRSILGAFMQPCRNRAGNDARFSTSKVFVRSSLERTAATYLLGSYMVAKILFILNAAAHVYYVYKFTGTNYIFYGLDIFVLMINGREWTHSGRFPRKTVCEVILRRLGNLHFYSLECGMLFSFFEILNK